MKERERKREIRELRSLRQKKSISLKSGIEAKDKKGLPAYFPISISLSILRALPIFPHRDNNNNNDDEEEEDDYKELLLQQPKPEAQPFLPLSIPPLTRSEATETSDGCPSTSSSCQFRNRLASRKCR